MPVIKYFTRRASPQRKHRNRKKLVGVLLLLLLLLALTFTSVSRFFWSTDPETSTDPRSNAEVAVIETEDDASRSAQLKQLAYLQNQITSLQNVVSNLQDSVNSLENQPIPSPDDDVPPETISHTLYNAYENLEYYNHIDTAGNTSLLTRAEITNNFLLKTAKLTDLDDVNGTGLANDKILKWNGTEWVVASDNDSNTTYSAGNGLSLSDTTFKLGGGLQENTTLDLDGFSFTFSDGNVTVNNSLYAGALYQNGNEVCDISGNCPSSSGSWIMAGDSGVSQSVAPGDTATFVGGAGLSTVASATDTLTFTIGAGTGISVGANDVGVDQSFGFAWTGAQSWSNTADFNGDVSFADTDIVFDGASTNLNITGNFSINTNDIFVQKSDGNVGIGTTTPAYALDVNGMINAVNGVRTDDDVYIGSIGLTDTATNTTSGAFLIGVFDEFTNSNSTNVQGVLADLDAAIAGSSHVPVTLAGPYDYLTLSGQQITLHQIDLTTDVTGILPLANGGTNADLSSVSTGGIIYKGATALQGSGSLTGVLKGNGSSAPTAMTGTQNYVTRWTDANSLGTGVLYDNNTNVGISTTVPGAKFDVVGGSIRADGNLIAGDLFLGYDDTSATITTFDTDESLTLDPDGTGSIFLHGSTHYIDSNGLVYVGGLATTSYTPTAGELRADVFRDGNSSYYIQPADSVTAGVFAGNIGIGTTSPDFALQVNGVIAPETTDLDLGTTSLRWDVFANTINADSTVTFSGLSVGTDNTVLTLSASNQVETREIDSRVWGSTLVDGSGVAGYVSYWSDSDTLTSEQYLSTIRGGLGNDVTAATGGEILYSTGATAYESLPAGTLGYVLVSGGTGPPSWIDSGALGSSYWAKIAGVLSPALGEPIAATSSATTVATFTSNGSNFALQVGGSSAFATFDNGGNIQFTNAGGSSIDASGGLTIGGVTQTGLILGRTGVTTRIANLTTDGVVYTSGGNGTLNAEAQLAIARGGTNTSATPTAGAVAYGNGSAYAFSSAGTIGQTLLSGGTGTPTWGTLGLVYGGTNADLSGAATGGIIYKGASALASTGALTGVLKGNGSSPPSAMTGTTNYVARWTDANTIGTGVLYDNGTNVGVGTTSPDFALQVNGDIAPETTDSDLGSSSLRWDVFANTLNADNTVTFSGLSGGTDNTVLILGGTNQVETREIDPGVWSGSLVAGSGVADYVTYWLDADTLTSEQYLSTIRGGLGNNVTAAGAGEILYSSSTTTYDSLAAGTLGYVLSSGGAGAPTWVDPATLGTNFWQYTNGALSPRTPYTNNTDLLVGADATAGAKFAVLNVFPGSGTPTASVSSGINGNGMYMTADGSLATTRRTNLTIGNSSTYNTTGSVLINSNGTGNVGIGTTATASRLDVVGATNTANIAQFMGDRPGSNVNVYMKHTSAADTANSARMTFQLNTDSTLRTAFEFITGFSDIADGTRTSTTYFAGADAGVYGNRMSIVGSNVGIANVAPTARLDITGSASTSGTLSFRGTTNPKINILNDETLGIQTSPGGDVGLVERITLLSGGNVGIGSAAPSQRLEVGGEIELANFLYFGNASTESLNWNGSNFLLSDDLLPSANDVSDLGSDAARWKDLYLGGETLHIGDSLTDEGTISYTAGNILSFGTDSTTNGDIAFFTNDLYLDKSAGNVGINTTAPAQTLHVIGDVRISGLTASLPVKTNANKDLISGAIDLATEVTGLLPLTNGGTNADLSGVSTGGLIYKGATSLEGSGSLTGVLKGNGSSAPTAMTGTTNYVTRWTDANSLGTGVLYDDGTNVGISTTTPSSFKLEIAGSIGPTANNTYDLGSDTRRWANVYATTFLQGGNTVCDSSGNCASVGNLWQYVNGAISPSTPYTNNTDLLVGADATAGAKFAVLNVFPGSGTPTASVSSGISGNGMYMTADGSLATTRRTNLTIGNSSTYNTTGSVLINSNGTGNVGIGTTVPTQTLHVASAGTREAIPASALFTDSTDTSEGVFIGYDSTNNYGLIAASDLGAGWHSLVLQPSAGNVGIGFTAPAAKLDVDTGSNTTGLRLRGLAETVEIADMFVAANGNLVLSTTGGTGTGSHLDLRGEDDQYGLVLRESDGTGTATFANLYVVDTTDDYLSINVNSATDGDALVVAASNNVGIGTSVPATRLHLDAAATAYDAAEGLAIFQDNSDRQIVIGGLGMFRRDANANADLRMNYLGYNGGTTQFRDLVIYDGKSVPIAIFDGSSGYLGVGTTTPNQTIQAYGSVDGDVSMSISNNYYNAASTDDTASLRFQFQYQNAAALSDAAVISAVKTSTYQFAGNNDADLTFSTEIDATLNERMRIMSNGNVGIGVTTAAARLDIDTGSNTFGMRLRGLAETVELADIFVAANGPLVLSTTAGTGTGSYLDLRGEDDQFGLILRESDGTGTATYANFYVTDAADDYLSINVVSAVDGDALNITASNNVGIGTNVPAEKLHVVGNILVGAAGLADITSNENASSYLKLSDNTKGDINEVHLHARDHLLLGTTDEEIFLRPGDTDVMTLTTGGNVGIGDTTPDARIHSNAGSGGTTAMAGYIYGSTNTNTFTDVAGLTRSQATLVVGSNWSSNSGSVLNVYTNGVDGALFVSATANVGIGTITPGARFHINASGEQARFDDTGATGNPFISLFQAGTRRSYIQHLDVDDTLALVSEFGALSLNAAATAGSDTNTEYMRIIAGGNIGIRNSSPTSELQIGGTTPELRIGDDGAEDTSLAFMGNALDYYIGLDDSTDLLTIGTGTTVGTNTRLIMNTNGNVGIGTTTAPSNKLQVVGASSNANPIARIEYEKLTANVDGNILRLENTGTDDAQYGIYVAGEAGNYFSGNVGIGTLTTGQELHVNGNIRYTAATADNNTTQCRNSSGDLAGCTSLLKYKTDIAGIGMGLDTVMQLRPVQFTWVNNTGDQDIGFIAEEVDAINPLLTIHDNPNGALSGVRYSQMTALLTKAIQEQQGQIQGLKSSAENLTFTSDGTLNVTGSSTAYTVTPVNGSPLTNIIGASQAFVGKLTAGLITTKELVVQQSAQIANLSVTNLTVSGQSINDYIRGIVQLELQNQPTPLPADAIAQNFNSGMVINNYNTTVTIIQSPTASSSTTFSATGSGEIANYFNVTEVTEVRPDGRLDILASLISWTEEAAGGIRNLIFNAPTQFRYLAWFQGPVKVNADTSGILIIPADTLKARVSFSKAFPEVPTIYVNFSESVAVNYTISDVNQSGFTINFTVAPDRDLSVQWLALLRSETQNGPSLEVMETGSASAPAMVDTPTLAPTSTPTNTPAPITEPTPTPGTPSGELTSLSDLINTSDNNSTSSASPSGTASSSAQTQ